MPPPSSPLTGSLPFSLLPETTRRGFLGSRGRRSTAERPSVEDPVQFPKIPIVCFCHLSWSWVWQRPQQFLSRLARTHPVLFVETYCSPVERTQLTFRTAKDHPTVTVLEMHLPNGRWSDGAFIDGERRRALQHALQDELAGEFDRPILWFYDPMAVTAFAGQLDEQLIVYDCMDELSQFKGAPPALVQRERQLLEQADVVFCGGRKMREKRLPLNSNCHFYGTGVEVDHFGRALSDDLPVDPQIAALRGPVLGYFGVIDERIDYELLAALADARADWSIAMVGPTAKVDPASFPQRPNLHWLGPRPYAELPAITKGFAVCLMPFALNAATEYINPTKALEYMATGRPVVSTALDEVKSNFGRISRIGRDHDEFIHYCIRESDTPSRLRIERGLRLARENTWEKIAARMEQHMQDALPMQRASSARARAKSDLIPLARRRAAYV